MNLREITVKNLYDSFTKLCNIPCLACYARNLPTHKNISFVSYFLPQTYQGTSEVILRVTPSPYTSCKHCATVAVDIYDAIRSFFSCF